MFQVDTMHLPVIYICTKWMPVKHKNQTSKQGFKKKNYFDLVLLIDLQHDKLSCYNFNEVKPQDPLILWNEGSLKKLKRLSC